jgi:hypothetical protein
MNTDGDRLILYPHCSDGSEAYFWDSTSTVFLVHWAP